MCRRWCPSLFLLSVLASGLALHAADTKPVPTAKPAASSAGKADALQAFSKQLASATQPTGPNPEFIGEYLWSGRADENYRPFFQWEFRLKAGSAALTGLSCRVTTLGPTKQPLSAGTWKPLANLAAGGSLDFDYKQNCTTFNAYQVELTWQGGGKETYLAWDKLAVPVALGGLTNTSFLVTLNQNFDYAAPTRTATVTYVIWNVGGQAAREVSQVIHFKDDKGKDVFTSDYKPEKGEIAPGYVKEQKVVVGKVPAFATISLSSKLTDAASFDQGAFSGAKDVEVAKIHAEGKALKARVRNGTGGDLDGVVVTITLQTKEGKAVKAVDLSVGKLAKGEEKDISADITGVPAWSGYEVGWKSAEAPAPSSATPALPAAAQVVKVDGVEFTIVSTKAEKDGMHVAGRLVNRRAQDLDGLVVTFKVPDGGGKQVPVELKPGRLAKGEELSLDFVASGVKAFAGLVMEWKSVAAGEAKTN